MTTEQKADLIIKMLEGFTPDEMLEILQLVRSKDPNADRVIAAKKREKSKIRIPTQPKGKRGEFV